MEKKANENKSGYVTRSAEEDILVISTTPNPQMLTLGRNIVIILMSVVILCVYLTMNRMFYPNYPVINTFAEKNAIFTENYPPFRMNEHISEEVTRDIVAGNMRSGNSLARDHAIGYPLIAALLTSAFGDIGLYYTNAFIMWICAVVFFLFMIQIVKFHVALIFTFIFAFATPNLFFASSAYCEPLSQLLTILSFMFLLKGLLSHREFFYYSLCGLSVGLNMFVQPFMALAVVMFAGVIFAERSRRSWKDRGVLFLLAGYAAAILVFLLSVKLLFGELPDNIFFNFTYLHYHEAEVSAGEPGNILVGIWKILFDSPHGLMFIMPITMVFPMGLLLMCRNKLRSLAAVVGAVVLYNILFTALSCCPISGESVGSRLLLPIVPLLIVPAAFLWDEELGEKIWLIATLVLTIYMCSFGWWTGTVRERGFLIGVLHDRDAQYIILARKNILERPVFRSNDEIRSEFFAALENGDIKQWLQTLDRTSVNEIRDFERSVFNTLMQNVQSGVYVEDDVIESVDPENGIRLSIPELGAVPD